MREIFVILSLKYVQPPMCALLRDYGSNNIIIIIIIYLFSVNTFTPIENCAIIFVIAQVENILIGQKIQKLQNPCKV